MESNFLLKIVKTKRTNIYWTCFLIIVYFWIVNIPLVMLRVQMKDVNKREDTKQILYDMQQMYQAPKPFASSWIDRNMIINGSTYRMSHLDVYFVSGIILINYPWWKHLDILFSLIRLLISAIRGAFALSSRKRSVIFTTICAIYGVVFCLAMDGSFNLLYTSAKDNMIKWIERNIVNTNIEFKNNNKIFTSGPHPFTGGQEAPFYLNRVYRYLMEDSLFVCEYSVFSEQNARPILRSSWWKKNGVPVELNDRVLVNVTIYPDTNVAGKFIIRSTLSILMINENDYGHYSCDYANPMSVPVKPHKQDNSQYILLHNSIPEFFQFERMSPHPNCDCQPLPKTELDYNAFSDYMKKFCFAEFELIKHPEKESVIPVVISPGGILIDHARYWTLADVDELSIDVTSGEVGTHHRSPECCSLSVKLYWIFFRDGQFVHFPFSRQVEYDHFIHTVRWLCICNSSFGLQTYNFYRRIYNSTTKTHDDVEINYPPKLLLKSTQIEDDVFGSRLCTDKINPSFFCSVINYMMENNDYTLYFYDVIAALFIFVFASVIIKIILMSRHLITKPIYRLCMYTNSDRMVFEAVQGPPLENIRKNNVSNRFNSQYNYDFFLSYNEEDMYDRAVARNFKDKLLGKGLTVFDVGFDILPGHLNSLETSNAIHSSKRFIIIASQSYTEDTNKQMEFFSIQDTIVSQSTEPKGRLLVVKLDSCEITGIHRVACITVPEGMKDQNQIHSDCLSQFVEWELATRPAPLKTGIRTYLHSLARYGFSWKSSIILCVILGLAYHSPIVKSLLVDQSEETDLPCD